MKIHCEDIAKQYESANCQMEHNKQNQKIKHKNLQKEIKQAIMDSRPDGQSILTKGNFTKCFINLGYCQALKQDINRYELEPQVQKDILKCEEFLAQIWFIMNPLMELHVSKANVFDFLLLLLFNVGHMSELQTVSKLALYLNQRYTQMGIMGFIGFDENEEKTNHLSINPCQSEVTEVELELINRVNSYLTSLAQNNFWQLNKIVQKMRVEETLMFAYKVQKGEQSQSRAKSYGTTDSHIISQVASGKSPKDGNLIL